MAVAKRLLSGNPIGFETLTVADTSVGFTSTEYIASDASHIRAYVTVDTGQLRYRYDATAPTSTIGHLSQFGDCIIVEGKQNVTDFRAIRTGDQSAILSVTYEAVHG